MMTVMMEVQNSKRWGVMHPHRTKQRWEMNECRCRLCRKHTVKKETLDATTCANALRHKRGGCLQPDVITEVDVLHFIV